MWSAARCGKADGGGDTQALDQGTGAARGAARSVMAALWSADAGVAVAGVGGADGVLRAAGDRPVVALGHRVEADWLVARAGSLDRRRDFLAAAGIIEVDGPPDVSAAAGGLAMLIAATAAGVKSYRVIDVPAELAWTIAAAASPWAAANDWAR